jgi:hypothetical protein
MAVLGSNTLNHSADLLIQRAGATRITVTSAGITVDGTLNAGKTVFTKNAHASGASDFHLELFSSNINAANEVSLRMHQSGQWFGQIRLRSDGFHFTDGGNNNYRNIFFGTATASGTVTGPTFNATSTTSGGFQGIDADGVSTPSFTWSGDLTTGIYRATTSDVGITGGGVVRARFGGSILLYKNTFVLPVDDVAADGTTTTRASGTLNWRGKYWNGTSSVNTDWNIIYVPTNTSGAGDFRIRNGGTTRLTVNNSGTVTASTFSGALSGNATTATNAQGSSFATASTTSEGRLVVRFSGQNDAYLFSNDTRWGLFSNSGGIILEHVRSTNQNILNGTATNANKINRNAIAASNTGQFRVLLGEANNNSGFQNCFVVTDQSRLFYQPSSNTLTCGTFIGALSGTATNANQLGGHVRQSGAATANTVAGRDGSGDIYARLIRQTFANQTTISGGMVFRVNDSTDNYLRVCSDTAAIRTFLDVPTRTGGNASGTWGISVTGNAATATTATNCSRQILSGNGMNFTGGQLNTDRTITLGTPGTITGATTNSVTTSSHTHALTVNLGVTAGTTAGPIITSSAGTNATIPTASGTASGVVTTGNQTWAGVKRFNNTIYFGDTGFTQDNTSERWVLRDAGQLYLCNRESTADVTNLLSIQRPNSNGTAIRFIRSTTTVGNIRINASSVSYNTTSDYRLKENVVALSDAIGRLKQLPVHRFNFIGDAENTVDGFLAHEVQEVVPECATGTKDGMRTVKDVVLSSDGKILDENIKKEDWESGKIPNEDDESTYPANSTWTEEYEVPEYQGIDQSKIVPLLTAALQEAIEKIETLEVKVSQLEAS